MMTPKSLLIILFILPKLALPQSQADSDIFERILLNESQNGSFYIQCKKAKTHFTCEKFNNEQVPENIQQQLESASLKSDDSSWTDELFNSKSNRLYLRGAQCLSINDCEDLFETTGQRQPIISISDPIFDSDVENCVVSVVHWNFKGSASGQSYFLSKVYGQWSIIFTFDWWLT